MEDSPSNPRGRVTATFVACLALALSLGPFAAHCPAVLQCKMEIKNDAFIPCGEPFMMQRAVGMSLERYSGQPLHSDGELIDLFDEAHAIRSEHGLLETEFDLTSATPDNPLLVGSRPYRVITYPYQGRVGGIVYAYNE